MQYRIWYVVSGAVAPLNIGKIAVYAKTLSRAKLDPKNCVVVTYKQTTAPLSAYEMQLVERAACRL